MTGIIRSPAFKPKELAMRINKNSGFTLLEICIVAVIIAILAALAIPNYIRALERTKYAQCLAILKSMANAAADFHREKETFTEIYDISDLETQAGAYYYSGADNPDWRFSIAATSTTTFSIQAQRTSGLANNGQTVIINELGHLSGTYNRADPAAGI